MKNRPTSSEPDAEANAEIDLDTWQDWIERLDKENLSEQELEEFKLALEQDPDNIDAYLQALLLDTSLDASLSPLSSPIDPDKDSASNTVGAAEKPRKSNEDNVITK